LIYFSNLVIIKHKYKFKINITKSCSIISCMEIIQLRFIKKTSLWIHFQMLCLLSFRRIRCEILLKKIRELLDHFRSTIKFSNLINHKFIKPKKTIQYFKTKIKRLNFLKQHRLIITIIFMGIMKNNQNFVSTVLMFLFILVNKAHRLILIDNF